MGEIQQAGLLRSLCHFNLKFVAGLNEFPLNAAAHSGEARNQHRETDQHHNRRDIRGSHSKGVKGRREKVIEAKAGEYYGQNCRPWSQMPGGERDGEQ